MMEKSHYRFFKRVLFTEQSKAQRIFNYCAIGVGIAESVYGWYLMLK